MLNCKTRNLNWKIWNTQKRWKVKIKIHKTFLYYNIPFYPFVISTIQNYQINLNSVNYILIFSYLENFNFYVLTFFRIFRSAVEMFKDFSVFQFIRLEYFGFFDLYIIHNCFGNSMFENNVLIIPRNNSCINPCAWWKLLEM